ncbi:hypothetical protein BZA70DRAFT_236260 [Myxozyma melibiosi]|uniref:Lysophospholipase NTE1 n=1 Tax=Myxozyma melibiosi TaxID=54550 RepID=A0ABR1FC10_9ASCO
MLWFFPRLMLHALTLIAYYIPAQVFALLGTSFSITLSFYSLLFIMLAFGTIVWAYVRYRYLNIYSQLPREEHRVEPKVDVLLYPTSMPSHYDKPGFSSYLDEFFSGIKVFGYLEKQVFHELTRHVQTRKLIAGDTMLLEEEKGFCIVVDGEVQIYARPAQNQARSSFSDDSTDGDDEDGGYRLLTEVRNGAPMSSLFTILSLFTEDIDISPQAEHERRPSSAMYSPPMRPMFEDSVPMRTDYKGDELSPKLLPLPNIPPLNERPSSGSYPGPEHNKRHRSPTSSSDPAGIIARASTDSTIAVIPAEAFRRLTQKYPQSAAHIVQVILARFQRVTFQTGNNYLGLTSEILKTEVAFNELLRYNLPSHISASAIERIKAQFDDMSEEQSYININTPKRRTSDAALSGTPVRGPWGETLKTKPRSTIQQIPEDHEYTPKSNFSHDKVMAGDLASNTPPPTAQRHASSYTSTQFVPQRPHLKLQLSTKSLKSGFGSIDFSELGENDEDSDGGGDIRGARIDEDENRKTLDEMKGAVVESILEALGVTRYSLDGKSPTAMSAENSPRFNPFENRRNTGHRSSLNSVKGGVPTGLGNLGFGIANPVFLDDESVASSSIHQQQTPLATFASIKKELCKDVEIVHYKADTRIVKQGDPNLGLYYVIDGFLDVCSREKSGQLKTIYTVKPGGIGGYLGAMSGYNSFVDIRATTDVYIGFLPNKSLDRLIERQAIIMLTMAKRLTSVISSLILHLDFALEWVQIGAGEVLYRQGDEADSIFIVLNGRLRALKTGETGEVELFNEFGQGESVGELEVLTSSKRPFTMHAVRDTEIVRFPRTLFESLALQNPAITIKISQIIASRVNSLVNKELRGNMENTVGSTMPMSGNFRTVAILPVTSGLPAKEFATRLSRAIMSIGQTSILLDQAAVLKHLGRHSFNKLGKLKLSGYLTDLEERYQTVLYVVDTAVTSPWTQTCISQADCILLLADANADPSIGEYERVLLTAKTTARKELVLLHQDRYVPAGQTKSWLKHRTWVHSHHHVQMQFRGPVPSNTHAFLGTQFRKLKNRVQNTLQTELQKFRQPLPTRPVYLSSQVHKNDFARLARILSGQSVGLVLGGGGARGLSHYGVIRALEEEGIPIDIVGGTSIGAFVGGLYARDSDMVPIYGRLKKFSGRMTSLWRMLFDLTYPATSYTTGHEFNRGIWKAFGDSRIEDFWLQYYNNTTNITHSRMDFHSSGYAWRYIRASMTLAGLLPPLTDDGSMLMDGGYVDNLTVTHMKALGANVVFAVDVGSVDDTSSMSWGDSLSGFWVLLSRINIFSRQPTIPSMADIQARLAYVSSVGALEKAKNMRGVVYMRPPIEKYGTLEFGKFTEISDVGYEYAKEFFAKLKQEGKFPEIPGVARVSDRSKRIIQRRNSI